MFEHAVLENSYGNRRAFATGAGFAGQAALATFIAIAPMIWPQVLPQPRLTMTLAPPRPVPEPPPHTAAVRPRELHNSAPLLPRELLIPDRMLWISAGHDRRISIRSPGIAPGLRA